MMLAAAASHSAAVMQSIARTSSRQPDRSSDCSNDALVVGAGASSNMGCDGVGAGVSDFSFAAAAEEGRLIDVGFLSRGVALPSADALRALGLPAASGTA